MAYASRLELIIDSRSGEQRLRSLEGGLERVEQRGAATAAAMRGLSRMVGMVAGALSVRQVTRYADSWTNMTSRVELSIGAQEDAADVMSQLADIARQTYSSMESTTEAFARNSFTLRALGKSTQDQINFTGALNNALAVSGSEGERALMVQNSLSRAMAEGTLRGEDLNNVLNSGSRVAELLADELGVNVTQLRAVAAEGRITSSVIYDSLVGAMDELSEESMGMGSTVRGSMRLMGNATLEAVGQLNQMYDASGTVARGIVQVSDAIRGVDWATHAGWISGAAGAVGALGAAYGTAAVASGVLTVATRTLNTVMRANPLLLAASAAVALGGALYAARNAVVTFGDTTASVMDWMRGTWLATSEIVATTMGGALQSSEGYWGTFVDYLRGAWDWVSVTFTALMNSIGQAAKSVVNWQIGLWRSVGDVVVIVAGAMQDAFVNAFDNVLAIGKGFWESLTQVLSGNFNFQPFRDAVRGAFIEPLDEMLEEMAGAVSRNMSTDYLGGALEIASDSVRGFGESISDYTFRSRIMRGEVEDAADSFKKLGVDVGGTLPPITNLTDKLTKAQRDAIREADRFASSLQSLQDQLFPVEAAQRLYREEQAILTRAWNEGSISADRYTEAMRRLEEAQLSAQTPGGAYGGIGFGSQIGDPVGGMGATGEGDYWDRWLASAETALTDFDQLAANTAENFQRGFGNAFEAMVFDSQSLGDAMHNLADGVARSMVSALGEMAAQWLAYQAVQMMVGRSAQSAAVSGTITNALAKQQEAQLNAYAATAAIPMVGPAMAPAAAAAAMAATTPMVAAISSLASSGILGQAHGGWDNLPKTGTYNLEKGERVVSSALNRDLTRYLERAERNESNGGSITIHAPVTVQAQPGMSNQDAQRQGSMMGKALRAEVLKIMQDQQRPGGVLAKR